METDQIVELAKRRVARLEQHKTHRQLLQEAMPEGWPETVKQVLAYDYASNWEDGWPEVPEFRSGAAGSFAMPTVDYYRWAASGVEHTMVVDREKPVAVAEPDGDDG